MYRQISEFIREKIKRREFKSGELLPSIRKLSVNLKVSVDTIREAYKELSDEGFILSQAKTGYFIADIIRSEMPLRTSSIASYEGKRFLNKRCSRASEVFQKITNPERPSRPFACFDKPRTEFPTREWVTEAVRVTKSTWSHSGYINAFGLFSLRSAICDQLRRRKGIYCTPEQVIVTSGTIQSLSFCARLLFEKNEGIFLEDPSNNLFKEVFAFSEIMPIFIPVDKEGIVVSDICGTDKKAKGVLVESACQYPMSVTLSKDRKHSLIDWARRTGSWIIEDDMEGLLCYGSEGACPLRSLPTADECTIYIDSFSLLIYPGIRLGYMVVPEALAASFAGLKLLSDRQSSESQQALMAHFLSSSDYDRHLRKLTRQYGKRKDLLVALLNQELGGFGRILSCSMGTHISFLLDDIPDQVCSKALSENGVSAAPLSSFCSQFQQNGLILGFGTFDEKETETAVKKMKQTMSSLHNCCSR